MPPFQSRYRILELFGIPLYIDISLILLLLMFALGGGSPLAGLACALMLLFSITLHELGHSLTARIFGYETQDITLSLLGGCASLIALPRKGSQEFATAIAGPAVSFLLSLIGAGMLAAIAMHGGILDAIGFVLGDALASLGIKLNLGGALFIHHKDMWLAEIAFYFATMNAMLGFFNLLPGFPLDGGRIFRSVMQAFMSRPQATRIAMLVGRGVAIFLGFVGISRIFNHGSWGFVTLMIAWMIWKEGYREYLLSLQDERFRDWSQADFNIRVSPPPYDRDP